MVSYSYNDATYAAVGTLSGLAHSVIGQYYVNAGTHQAFIISAITNSGACPSGCTDGEACASIPQVSVIYALDLMGNTYLSGYLKLGQDTYFVTPGDSLGLTGVAESTACATPGFGSKNYQILVYSSSGATGLIGDVGGTISVSTNP